MGGSRDGYKRVASRGFEPFDSCYSHIACADSTKVIILDAKKLHQKMATTSAIPRSIDLAAILKSPQPEIDLRLQEFETTTRKFLKAVSEYTNRAIEEINQRKSKHAQDVKRLEEKAATAESEITACKVKEIKLMEGVYIWLLVARNDFIDG